MESSQPESNSCSFIGNNQNCYMYTATAVKLSLSETNFKGSIMSPDTCLLKKKWKTAAVVQLCVSILHVVQLSYGMCQCIRDIINCLERAVWLDRWIGVTWRD